MPHPQNGAPVRVPKVEVLEVKPMENKGNLKAFASVKIGPLVIHSLKIVQQPGQRAWVGLPQSSYTTRDGQTKYSPILEAPREWTDAIQEAVLAQWQPTPRQPVAAMPEADDYE